MNIEQHKAAALSAYARLAADPVAWADYESELAEWDGVANDGLEDEPPWSTATNSEEL